MNTPKVIQTALLELYVLPYCHKKYTHEYAY